MKRVSKKVFSIMLVLVIVCSVFSGCNSNKPQPSVSEKTEATKAVTPDNISVVYPVKTDVTITYWREFNVQNYTNYGDTPIAKELEKKTGIKCEFQHPPAGQAKQQINLMLASNDMPDIIEYNWYGFSGGPEKAIQSNYIIKLNDAIDQYAPNLKKYLKANPDMDKMVKTDSGSYYVFPFIRGDELLRVSTGPIFRKDWLDDLGLQVPTTIDEWYTTLKAFKDKKGAEAPLSFNLFMLGTAYGSAFAGSFGVDREFYVDGGKVKYGPMESAFKDYLATFKKWYAEGLLDKDFAVVDGKTLEAKITTGKSGATIGYAGGRLGAYLNLMKDKDPKYNLVGAPHPTLKKGEVAKIAQIDNAYVPGGTPAITSKCKNVEIAAKLLDYGYSEEGHNLYNFGIEGVSFKMENGYPKYTDLIMKNPEGLAISVAMGRYIRANQSGPFVQDKRYVEQYYELPQQKAALNTWMKSDGKKYKLPPITPTPDESSTMATHMNEITTYVDEMYLKFVFGVEPIENFDKYVEQIKKMGIEKVLGIQQAALDRYNKR